jgi:hypothetical protein
MSIPNKQIGWSQESNLLWYILKQLNKLTSIIFNIKPTYKVYTALLTQSGTSAPTATILENTLGGDIVWSYTSPGNYLGTLSGAFPIDKYFSPIPISGFDGSVNVGGTGDPYFVYRENTNSIRVIVQGGFNNSLNNTPIEIKVYS